MQYHCHSNEIVTGHPEQHRLDEGYVKSECSQCTSHDLGRRAGGEAAGTAPSLPVLRCQLCPPVPASMATPTCDTSDCDTYGLWHLWLWLWHPPAPRPAGRSCSLVTSQGHQSQRATRTRPEPLQQQTVTHWAGTCISLHRVKQRCQRGPQTFTALQKSLVLSCLIILQKQFWDPWQTNPSMQRRHMMPRWPLLSSFNTHMFQVYFQLAVKEWGFGVVKILLGRKNPYRCWKKSFHYRRISTKDTLH